MPLVQKASPTRTETARINFAFLESYFFIEAMQHIQQWTSAFDYTDLDQVIGQMKACNAFEKSRKQYQLLNVSDLGAATM